MRKIFFGRSIIKIVLKISRFTFHKISRAVVYRQYTCFGSTETGFNSQQPDTKNTNFRWKLKGIQKSKLLCFFGTQALKEREAREAVRSADEENSQQPDFNNIKRYLLEKQHTNAVFLFYKNLTFYSKTVKIKQNP